MPESGAENKKLKKKKVTSDFIDGVTHTHRCDAIKQNEPEIEKNENTRLPFHYKVHF